MHQSRMLFDRGTPAGLARARSGRDVPTVRARGWDRLSHGNLLRAAENAGYDMPCPTGRRMRYRGNRASRRIAILVRGGSTQWAQDKTWIDLIAGAVDDCAPAAYRAFAIPHPGS